MPGYIGSTYFMLPAPLDKAFVDAFFDDQRPMGHPIMEWLDEAKPMSKATWEKLVKDGVGLGKALDHPVLSANVSLQHFTITVPNAETVALREALIRLATMLGQDFDTTCRRVDQVAAETGLDAFQAINWLRDDEWNRRNRAAAKEYAAQHQAARWPDPDRFDKWTGVGFTAMPTIDQRPVVRPLPDDVVDRAILLAFPFTTDLRRLEVRRRAGVPLAGEKELTRTPFSFDEVARASDLLRHDPVADMTELLKTWNL